MSVLKTVFASTHRKPIPVVSGVAPLVRTNYNLLALGGGLDPLWAPNGKHTAGAGTIDIVNDPLGIYGHVQRHVVHTGDVLWGGDRCEVMTSQIGGPEGVRYQLRFDLYLPSNFYSDSGGWNSLWDTHYPNDGPAISPIGASIRNSNELWLTVFGGPISSDGSIGTIRNEARVAILQRGVWNELAFDFYMHASSGIMDVWVNKSKVTTWGSIPTLSPNVNNGTYWKQGFYRPANNPTGTQEYYFTDTLMWKESSPDAMLAWAA